MNYVGSVGMNTSGTIRLLVSDEIDVRAFVGIGREVRIWDTELIGFCLRIQPSGKATYCLKHAVEGKPVWRTIGVAGGAGAAFSARAEAQGILARSARPRPGVRASVHDLTVEHLVERYLQDGPLSKLDKRASSWKTDASNLRRHVTPALGHRPAALVTREEVAQMALDISEGRKACVIRTKKQGYARISGGAGTAQRTLQTLAAAYAWAVKSDLVSSNPVKGLKLPRRASKERFLSVEEGARLFVALEQLEAENAIRGNHADAIRLLLLTGARKSEIVALQWAEIDFGRKCLVLAPERSKTGNRVGDRRIYLGDAALAILARTPRTSAYVFPAAKGNSRHFTSIWGVWQKVRDRAVLGSMRIHDLRHSFASFAVQNGESIALIRDALGHTTLRMTERYLHLGDQSGRDFAERNSKSILDNAMCRAGPYRADQHGVCGPE